MRIVLYTLGVYLAFSVVACSSPNTSVLDGASPTPTPTRVYNDTLWAGMNGPSFADAKKAVEPAVGEVVRMNVSQPQGVEYFLALVDSSDGKRHMLILRPFTSDGEHFEWKAEVITGVLYQKLLLPPTATAPDQNQ